MEELKGQWSVGWAAKNIGSTLCRKQHFKHLLEHWPAVFFFKGNIAFKASQGSLIDVDKFCLLLIKADESEFDHVNSSYTALNDPLLKTTAISQVLLENKSSLGIFDVSDPCSICAGFYKTAD